MRRNIKVKAWILLILFVSEMFSPMHLMALGSGPSQPEMAAFTPAGTTEMVDPFTGDFTYNIPLMDVEGYPINIAYNSGVTMEQEASWVGLGWNLNVGTVNRSVRGIPDDFKGDEIETETSIKPMKIVKVGGDVVGEVFGAGGGSVGKSFIHNNYKGFGLTRSASIGVNIGSIANANVGIDVNTLDGTSLTSSLGIAVSSNQGKYGGMNFGASVGGGFNTRTGQTMLSLGTTAGYKAPTIDGISGIGSANLGASSTSLLPIGMDTYTPFPSLKMTTNTTDFSGTLGGAVFGAHAGLRVHGSITTQSLIDNDIKTPSYGYLYIEEAESTSLKDFNREKQVILNQTIEHLSPVSFTYDVYSVTGQGVSGMFRPFRNDIGVLSDPSYSIDVASSNSYGAEYGGGLYFHGGLNYNTLNVESTYGSWSESNDANYFNFKSNKKNSLYEKVYFKSAGDKSESDIKFFEDIGGYDAYAFNMYGSALSSGLTSSNGNGISQLAEKKSNQNRSARSKVFTYLTAKEAESLNFEDIESVEGGFYQGGVAGYKVETILRVNSYRKAHHISEITQINPDGERYVFGIPAYNNIKKEVTYNAENVPSSTNRITHNDKAPSNKAGVDHYYSATTTPAYAHSYLLTAILSEDYQDITGDGVSPDDIGNAYSFKYKRTSKSYKWRTPYSSDAYMEGFKSNGLDQKASYTYGEKELWYMNSVQSKNQIAEFYTSERNDGLGVQGESGGKAMSGGDRLHQLDSIVLYNKLDRLENKNGAIPIKKISFTYDYSLCVGVENQIHNDSGKLTLKKIEISYGRGEYGKGSPYVFEYSEENPRYNPSQVDRWGNYKSNTENPVSTIPNWEYPYTLQDKDSLQDSWASAWSLTSIQTPEGGSIMVEYESDDYSYVQDRNAMQMFPVVGGGKATDYEDHSMYHQYNLYESDYLYIKRPACVSNELSKKELSRMFLGDEGRLSEMYFKFLTNIHSKSEYVPGYTSALEVGYCSNPDYLYIKLPAVKPNPISRTAWSFFRYNLFEVLYQQPNINNSGVEAVVRGILANINDIKQMFSGVEKYLKSRNIAKVFTPLKSFVRLYTPCQSKKGGGSRVKRVFLSDNWKNISGEGENSIYGQEYFYTIENQDGLEISSGVASYEPMIGGDENPFREPVFYTATKSQGHIPAIDAYQERPFGESFFPSATVGYSRIVVRSVHYNKGKTSNSITEHKYYTAKDFPVIIDATNIQMLNQPAGKNKVTFPFVNRTSKSLLAASQGYSITLNDMHGKPKSTINYLLVDQEEEGKSIKIPKLVSGRKYHYQTKKDKKGYKLDNKVKLITTDGRIDSNLLGVEVDVAIENRRTFEKSTTKGGHANLDIFPIPFPFAPIPIIIPTANHNKLTDIKDSKYQVLTKVIQQYGIISSVESFTDQYKQVVTNKLYDGNSGKVILTETKDEHKKNEFNLDFPAYMALGNELLGPAYQTIGLSMDIYPKSADPNCNPNSTAFSPGMPEQLKNGDEVIVNYVDGTSKRAWVVLDDDNKYNEPISNCEVEDTLFIPKYRRLLTTSALQSTDGSVSFREGKLKSKYGQRILESVKIYHLKESASEDYQTYCDTSNLISLNNCEVASPNALESNAVNLRKNIINHLYHREECSIVKQFKNTVGLNLSVIKEIINGGEANIFDPLCSNDSSIIYGLFDMYDTLNATIELMEVEGELDNIMSWESYNNHPSIIDRGVNVKTTSFKYKADYNSCSEFDGYSFFYKDKDGSYSSDFIIRADPIANGRLKYNTNHTPSPSVIDTLYSVTSRKVSRTSFRITDTSSFRPYFQRDEQLYLVEYQVKENSDTTTHYYIETGRAYEVVPWEKETISPYCANENAQWDSLRITATMTPCLNNFRMMDRSGDLLTVYNAKSLKIVRPAYRNQVDVNIGRLVAQKDPIREKRIGDRGEPGTYYKFEGFSEESIYLQANARTIKDKTNIVSHYPLSDNLFVSGFLGTFKQDSVLFFMGSRSQSESIRIANDGYIEELPSLWVKDSCSEALLSPDYYEEKSSGWKYREQTTMYSSNGQVIESLSNLGIPSAMITNQSGQVEAKGINCSHSNMAYDNFEQYYNFGKNILSKDGFRVNQTDTNSILKKLLNTSNANYSIVNHATNSIVKGVAHTGDYSMFVNKDNDVSGSNYTLKYKENNLDYLEQIMLSNNAESIQEDTVVNITAERVNQKNIFTSQLPVSTTANINRAYTNAPSLITFQLDVNDSCGNFNPDSGNYLISVWVKDLLPEGSPFAGKSPHLVINYNGGESDTIKASESQSAIIDGWKKLEGIISYDNAHNIEIKFYGGIWGAFFDDFRIHPVKSNLITYVYGRYNNKLTAQLDENNYAVFYEYDKAGIPSQLKKETSQGIITVSESRQSIHKK